MTFPTGCPCRGLPITRYLRAVVTLLSFTEAIESQNVLVRWMPFHSSIHFLNQSLAGVLAKGSIDASLHRPLRQRFSVWDGGSRVRKHIGPGLRKETKHESRPQAIRTCAISWKMTLLSLGSTRSRVTQRPYDTT
ncbi:hypothetical protein OH76DRAFT_64236 [Lentinus brumalis]|uniref:Uncharacterized protein n=1 Tax=Lentinus brumalis TaxID=2498619 RepID=A0A371DKI8_9APHY|nr:hypothetical protein OH76DRAFT_64236 [Polyporus brumalis]